LRALAAGATIAGVTALRRHRGAGVASVADDRVDEHAVISSAPREREGLGRQAAVYGLFVLLVVLYTWPLAADPGAHLRQWVTSGSKEHGWVASVEVNGVEVEPDRRGYNLAVVDPRTGAVVEHAVFDTFLSRRRAAGSRTSSPGSGRVDRGGRHPGRRRGTADRRRGASAPIDRRRGRAARRAVRLAPSDRRERRGAGTAGEALCLARLTRTIGRDRRHQLIIEDFPLE
jgi:hypothetical protein